MNSAPAEQAVAPEPGALSKRTPEDGGASIRRREQGEEERGHSALAGTEILQDSPLQASGECATQATPELVAPQGRK